MIHPNVAPGVHRIEDSYVNWYLVEDGNDLTVVDTGLPASWVSFEKVVGQIGRTLSDVKAVVLTHAHFDHVGFAEKARQELGVPVYAHEQEVEITKHPLSYEHERSRLWYAWRPPCAAAMASFVSWGMLSVKPISEVKTYTDGATLDVPGSPKVVYTPGHSVGHSSLLLEHRGTMLVGDAMVGLDPYTGWAGPRVVARAATAHSAQAKDSLNRLAAFDFPIVLSGHGEPLTGGATAAAHHAQQESVG